MTHREALERIVELETEVRIASDMPRHAVMAAIAKEALAEPTAADAAAVQKAKPEDFDQHLAAAIGRPEEAKWK